MFYIYIIHSLTNGKAYIGETKDKARRWSNHKAELKRGKHKNIHLQNAWNLHGASNFDFILIDSFDTKEDCDAAECFYIEWYKALDLSYNNQNGGWGPGKFSDETKEKIRQANLRNGNKPPSRKGVPISDELREKYRQSSLLCGAKPPSYRGMKHTEEAKEKIAQAKRGKIGPRTGKTNSPEMREKQRIAALGRKPSEACIEAVRIANTGREPWNKGKKMTPEYCEKCRQAKTRIDNTEV